MFSHEPEVGVKCRWKRGWRSSQRCTAGLVGGVIDKSVHPQVIGDLFVEANEELLELAGAVPAVSQPMTFPVAMSRAANRLVVPWRT